MKTLKIVLGVSLIKGIEMLVDVKEHYRHNDKFVDTVFYYVEKERHNL